MFERKNKNNKQKRSWFFWLILIFYLFKKVLLFRKSKEIKEIEANFKDFLHKENKEIKEYTKGKEDLKEFTHDSSNIFKDYFVPHSGNNHIPKILKTKSLSVILVATVLLKLSLVAYLYFIFPNPGKADSAMVARVLELLNKDRQAASLEALQLNPILSSSALAKANDIVAKDYFAHISPDGKKPWDWIDRGQYAYAIVGENLAMNFTTALSVHKALMNSPSHKHNIMNDKYSDIGLAMVSGEIEGKKTNVLVQIFSRPVERILVKTDDEQIEIPKLTETSKKASKIEPQNNIEVLAMETKEDNIEVRENLPSEENIKAVNDLETIKNLSDKTVEDVYEDISKTELKSIAKEKLDKANKKLDKQIADNKKQTVVDDLQDYISEETIKKDKFVMLIKHPGDQVLAQNSAEQMDYKLIQEAKKEESLPGASLMAENSENEHFIFSNTLVLISQIVFASVLSLLIISLLINIFVRFEIQHRPVLLQTTVVLLFVIALMFINFHYLEGGAVMVYLS